MLLRRFLPFLLALLLPAMAAAQGDPSFSLANRTGQPMVEVYVSPVTEQFWGRNRIAEPLASGRTLPVRLAPAAGCRHDVRVVYADGRSEERRNLDTCAIAELAFGTAAAPPRQGGQQAATGNPSFNLVNHGAQPLREIYVSSARETTWGPDRLGADILQPGRWLAVRLPVNDCVNDIRIVWMDGRQEERRGVDTCRVVNIVFR